MVLSRKIEELGNLLGSAYHENNLGRKDKIISSQFCTLLLTTAAVKKVSLNHINLLGLKAPFLSKISRKMSENSAIKAKIFDIDKRLSNFTEANLKSNFISQLNVILAFF